MVTLEEVKQHLRIDEAIDALALNVYIDAAIEQVGQHVQRKIIADESARENESDLIVNAALKAAVLLMVGNLYEHREATREATTELPLGYWSLIQPYRLMGL